MNGLVVDLFAGPGGWSEGLRMLGETNELGLELDTAACDTARAAGHVRLQADVAALDPLRIAAEGDVWGLIGSPPCQSFSAAGKGLGKLDRPRLDEHAAEVAAEGWQPYGGGVA